MKSRASPVGADGLAGRLAAAEEGRRQIAREIHDDFGQRLAGLALALRAARKQLPEAHSQIAELDSIGGSLAELGEDLRRLSHDLHPAALERRGLAEALHDHCAEIERRHGLRVDLAITGVTCNEGSSPPPPDIALGLYRIVQEALANTVRHAGAQTASVTLRATSDTARLTVADDGRGFAPAETTAGFGLTGMRERVHLVAGSVDIDSAPGHGTRLTVLVPRGGDER